MKIYNRRGDKYHTVAEAVIWFSALSYSSSIHSSYEHFTSSRKDQPLIKS